jgi:hypothetical protein
MLLLSTRHSGPSRRLQVLAAAAFAALVVLGLSAPRCEASQTAWTAFAGLAQAQPATAPGGIVRPASHALPASRTAQRRTDQHTAKIILAVVLAAVAAFDLWILRHVQKIHMPARSARRRLCRLRSRKRAKRPYID